MTSAARSPFLPEVPTLVEQGYKDVAVEEWLGWFLPAKTPPEIVGNLNRQVREALSAPDYVTQLASHALQPIHQSPEEFARRVKADYDKWAPIVRATGFTAED
jgi:tripartite-type tricarboxylate transporter receptor subunit TctC